MRIHTKRGYDLSEVASALQKAIRRGDTRLAGYWALEMWTSGYGPYVWRRLLTVSAEDCWGILTHEITALHDSYQLVNKGKPAREHRGRIFLSKAVILLCAAKKNRDADHLQNFVYDALRTIDPEKLARELAKAGRLEVPDYAFDCHTQKGRKRGKTKADFFREEQQALSPKQRGLFDDLPDNTPGLFGK
jgi:replication-associated recombination protein RarA